MVAAQFSAASVESVAEDDEFSTFLAAKGVSPDAAASLIDAGCRSLDSLAYANDEVHFTP